MARFFDGTDDNITTSLGALNFAFGPGTIAAVIRHTGDVNNRMILWVGNTTAVGYGLSIGNAASRVIFLRVDTTNAPNAVAISTNSWYLIAATKATGSVTPRIHVCTPVGGSFTNTHTNSGTSAANSSVPTVKGTVGAFNDASANWQGDIAAIGVWDVVLTDSQIDSLAADISVRNWNGYTKAKGLWIPGNRPYIREVLADSPKGYWRLGETSGTFADSSGLAHTATGSGTVTYSQPGATTGDTAVTLGAASGLLTATDHADFDFGDTFTLEAWFNFPDGTLPSDATLITKGPNGYQFYLYGARGIALNKDSSSVIVQSTRGSTPNNWHHAVVTKSGATVKLYLDGEDVTGTVTNATITDTAVDLKIGQISVTGSVDEVAVYATALSQQRVLAHFNAAGSGPVVDLSGNGANETARVGTDTTVDEFPPFNKTAAPYSPTLNFARRTPLRYGRPTAENRYAEGVITDIPEIAMALRVT